MKVGIIGLGNIAQKAYLPILCSKVNVESILVTRNESVLKLLSNKYRITDSLNSVEGLVKKNVDAAFVHSSTESHAEIIEKLLTNDMHVFVDKPISYNFEDSKRIADLAKKKGKILFLGFNRRFAPMYKVLPQKISPQIILMQKNRVNVPGKIRKFILDDFIHVIDTLRFLSPGEIKRTSVQPFFKAENLIGITVQFSGDNFTAIAIMNRNNGISEEILEAMGNGEKFVVKNLVETIHYKKDNEVKLRFDDWDYVLYRRGFVDMINNFIDAVIKKADFTNNIDDALKTHKICEDIINEVEIIMRRGNA